MGRLRSVHRRDRRDRGEMLDWKDKWHGRLARRANPEHEHLVRASEQPCPMQARNVSEDGRFAIRVLSPMRSRLRIACKRGGTVLTALIIALWIGSGWWTLGGPLSSTSGVELYAGRLEFVYTDGVPLLFEGGWRLIYRHRAGIAWSFDRLNAPGILVTAVCVPLWSLVLLTGMPTAWLWLKGRCVVVGACAECGFDLCGADHDVCPECGAPPPRRSPAEPRQGVSE